MNPRRLALALIAASLFVAGPARADKVLCDGNMFCLAVTVPLLMAGVALDEMKAKPPEKTGADYISAGKNKQFQKLLAAHPELLKDKAKAHSLLVAAAQAGNLEATEVLIKAGAAPDHEASRVLWIATSVEVIHYLTANGAVATQVDLAKVRHNISHPRLPELLEALLDARGALDPNDPGALDLLNTAIGFRRGEVVKLLLKRGVSPDGARRVPLVSTASLCAGNSAYCEETAIAIANDLLAAGAAVNRLDETVCRTPLQAARQTRYEGLAALFVAAGATEDAPPATTCAR